MGQHPDFRLSKWYADCIGERGEAVILYCAELRWGGLTIHYASRLSCSAGGDVQSNVTLRNCPQPILTGTFAECRLPPLGVTGTWKTLDPPARETVFASEDGFVRWECFQPRAEAEVRINGLPAVSGLGYLEHLEMTIPPWRLPIRRLRWGRFLSATDGVVWIDWEGPRATRMVFHNGRRVSAGTITDSEVAIEEERAIVQLADSRVLREGPLGTTALRAIPGLSRLAGGGMARVYERKWISRGVLRSADGPDARGWAIHEVVDWPSK